MTDTPIMPVTCLVVDDEPMARDLIKRYIDLVPSLELVAEFGNALDAIAWLQQHQVDLIFLDIQMPQLSGIDFVRSFQASPRIIFTTAFKEYAYDGYELDIVDYLLKPIRFDRFLKAVNKALPKALAGKEVFPDSSPRNQKYASPFIYIRVDRKMVKLLLDDISYIESDKDYVKLYTEKTSFMTRQKISAIEAMLPDNKFYRIHRSFIVNLEKIRSFTKEQVMIADKELPVGKLFRQSFLKKQDQR